MKPTLFNTEMVNAIQENRKRFTRRLIKPRYRDGDGEVSFQIVTNAFTGKFIRVEIVDDWGACTRILPPPCLPGDILYVRETWQKHRIRKPQKAVPADFKEIQYSYRADGELANSDGSPFVWRPSIHMPKEAARIFLRVKSVTVERLNDMQEDDAIAEGFPDLGVDADSPLERFSVLWDSTINREDLENYSWNANPWVWVIEFEKISREEAIKEGNHER